MAFKIFMAYHSHIDIGYTERQEKITQFHTDFIKQAVDCALSAKQSARGNESKFKFTAEGFFAVDEYLKRYGEQGKQKLLQAIESGNFELTAFYFHMADLLNDYNLRHTLSYAKNFAAENGLKTIKTAMAADINGFSWGMSQALFDSGVKNLVTCINTHHGGAPFGKPLVPFFWETPKGDKLLVWNGLTYHKANLLGLISGLTPIADPGVPGMTVTDTGFIDVKSVDDYARGRIFNMADGLKKTGYDKNYMLLMGSGLYTDNSPLDDGHCGLIEEWNAKYGNQIEIVTTTLDDFFKFLSANEKELPTYKGDWNDWWTDGALSTPAELRLFRNA